jgi:hypothetical protein
LRGEVENPKRIAGIYDHRLMVEYPSGLKEWDLENLKLELYKEKLYEADWDRYTFSRDLTKVGNGLKLESVNYLRYQRPSTMLNQGLVRSAKIKVITRSLMNKES